MMNKIYLIFATAMLLLSHPNNVMEAYSVEGYQTNMYQGDHAVIMSDRIELRYRVNNGVLQYRRFNASRNCWVDPYWINV